MIICHCTGITDRDVKEAARQGARTCEQVVRHCQAGGACGGCVPLIEMLLRPQAAARNAPQASTPRT